MKDILLWTALAFGAVCTVLAALSPPPASRMWRTDLRELESRRRMRAVLAAQTTFPVQPLPSPPAARTIPSPDQRIEGAPLTPCSCLEWKPEEMHANL
ncbi:hypothetical protein FBY35_1478 [Streptomyces sp. SLBN-118]|nr:hypothetical protein FBY35_1478 [Streptomyces sp. SLBN-118]